ncbi:hypothetical protein SISNIDRAFT_471174 [Sistotremastrum niveocremeum HHB9708]|uniref:Uncharacterized protein n=1 Tax=Sistotremastrum niveocremeum HHB9708 TaxID=1314777 RepID=A0A164MXS8_9AGAM|nr:hypothetical protein SISNIDRAFT_471174 [Sistotremastrum niveocremeum HHB9708]
MAMVVDGNFKLKRSKISMRSTNAYEGIPQLMDAGALFPENDRFPEATPRSMHFDHPFISWPRSEAKARCRIRDDTFIGQMTYNEDFWDEEEGLPLMLSMKDDLLRRRSYSESGGCVLYAVNVEANKEARETISWLLGYDRFELEHYYADDETVTPPCPSAQILASFARKEHPGPTAKNFIYDYCHDTFSPWNVQALNVLTKEFIASHWHHHLFHPSAVMIVTHAHMKERSRNHVHPDEDVDNA